LRVDFYHLASTALDRALPGVCEKVLGSGERLLIVADDGELARLDELLWSYSPHSFLPHGRAERASPEQQPILLSANTEALNGATNLVLADGLWRDEALAFARIFYFFGPAQLEMARTAWRSLKAKAEVEARYWKQDERGRWVEGP
jgi:DNA polymerase-3 subunit chi